MPMTGLAPVKQALVQALRSDTALKAALPGGIHEGFAPPKTPYPLLTYTVHFAPHDYLWGSVMNDIGFDVFVFAENSVVADNLDALVLTALHDVELVVTGQSTLICRRVSSLSLPDSNEEGKKIYQVGGVYHVITDQPLPSIRRDAFTLDAVLEA
jgi:hypothetical protein